MNPVLSHARGAPSHVPSSVFYCLANSSTRPRCITTEISDRVEKVHFLSVEKTHVTNVIDVKLEGSFGAKLSRKKGRKKRESRVKKSCAGVKVSVFFSICREMPSRDVSARRDQTHKHPRMRRRVR